MTTPSSPSHKILEKNQVAKALEQSGLITWQSEERDNKRIWTPQLAEGTNSIDAERYVVREQIFRMVDGVKPCGTPESIKQQLTASLSSMRDRIRDKAERVYAKPEIRERYEKLQTLTQEENISALANGDFKILEGLGIRKGTWWSQSVSILFTIRKQLEQCAQLHGLLEQGDTLEREQVLNVEGITWQIWTEIQRAAIIEENIPSQKQPKPIVRVAAPAKPSLAKGEKDRCKNNFARFQRSLNVRFQKDLESIDETRAPQIVSATREYLETQGPKMTDDTIGSRRFALLDGARDPRIHGSVHLTDTGVMLAGLIADPDIAFAYVDDLVKDIQTMRDQEQKKQQQYLEEVQLSFVHAVNTLIARIEKRYADVGSVITDQNQLNHACRDLNNKFSEITLQIVGVYSRFVEIFRETPDRYQEFSAILALLCTATGTNFPESFNHQSTTQVFADQMASPALASVRDGNDYLRVCNASVLYPAGTKMRYLLASGTPETKSHADVLAGEKTKIKAMIRKGSISPAISFVQSILTSAKNGKNFDAVKNTMNEAPFYRVSYFSIYELFFEACAEEIQGIPSDGNDLLVEMNGVYDQYQQERNALQDPNADDSADVVEAGYALVVAKLGNAQEAFFDLCRRYPDGRPPKPVLNAIAAIGKYEDTVVPTLSLKQRRENMQAFAEAMNDQEEQLGQIQKLFPQALREDITALLSYYWTQRGKTTSEVCALTFGDGDEQQVHGAQIFYGAIPSTPAAFLSMAFQALQTQDAIQTLSELREVSIGKIGGDNVSIENRIHIVSELGSIGDGPFASELVDMIQFFNETDPVGTENITFFDKDGNSLFPLAIERTADDTVNVQSLAESIRRQPSFSEGRIAHVRLTGDQVTMKKVKRRK